VGLAHIPGEQIHHLAEGCGKTTILRFLNQVVRRPKRAGSISPSALFRVVEKYQPTILLDETEKYIENGSDLHALLNEGHCKGGTVLRVLGDNLDLREFPVFGPVAFARNGRLPDDLEQRSIIVEMQRRKRGEPLAELREDRCTSLQQIARMCSRWADDYGNGLDDIDPDMGDLLNRDGDNWRPLFSIADLIGFLPVCEHCGNPERAGKPVEMFVLDGTEYRMHPACRAEWLAGPNPDDWSFNTDAGKSP
jgi:putative DNA primase/helicase